MPNAVKIKKALAKSYVLFLIKPETDSYTIIFHWYSSSLQYGIERFHFHSSKTKFGYILAWIICRCRCWSKLSILEIIKCYAKDASNLTSVFLCWIHSDSLYILANNVSAWSVMKTLTIPISCKLVTFFVLKRHYVLFNEILINTCHISVWNLEFFSSKIGR